MTHKRKTADQLYEERVQKLVDLQGQACHTLEECMDVMPRVSIYGSKYTAEYSNLERECEILSRIGGQYLGILAEIDALRTGDEGKTYKYPPIVLDNTHLGALHSTLQQFRNHVTGFKAKVLKAVKG